MRLKYVLAFTLFLLFAVRFGLPVSGSADETTSGYRVERKEFVKILTFSGQLEAVESIVITVPRTSLTSRYVVSFLAPEGNYIQPGDLLVEFDSSELETQRLELEKQREDARIRVAQKEAELQTRLQDLLLQFATAQKNLKTSELYLGIDPQLISRADAEKYQFDHSKAKIELEKLNERLRTLDQAGRAELEVTQLEFERAELDLKRMLSEAEEMSVRAPRPGRVIYGTSTDRERKLQVGDEVWRGWPVVFLPNMSALQIQALVTDLDFPLLKEGLPAEIIFDAAPDPRFRGEVGPLPQMAKPERPRSQFKVFRVGVRLLETDLVAMKLGMTAQVRVPISRPESLVVPRAAVALEPDGTTYVVRRTEASRKIPVEITDASWDEVAIKADLEPGDELVLPALTTTAQATEGFEWIAAKRQDLLFSVSGTGILQAEKSVQIGPPTIARQGNFRIARMIPEGIEVQEGDFLIDFDPIEVQKRLRGEQANRQKAREEYEKTKVSQELQIKDLELQLEEARVQLEQAEARLREAEEFEADLKVQEAHYEAELQRKTVGSLEKKLESVSLQMDLQLEILKDTENLHQHRVEVNTRALESLTVKAPISGFVLYETNRRNEKKQVGSEVYWREKVLSIPDLTTLVVNGQISEVDAGKISLGQAVNVTLDAIPERTFTGKVVEVGTMFRRASFDLPVKVLDIQVQIDQLDPKRMRPGMVAKLQVVLDRFEDVLAVPLSVVHVEEGKSFVWIKEGSKAVKKEITVGENNGIVAVIENGLEEDQEVASKPLTEKT